MTQSEETCAVCSHPESWHVNYSFVIGKYWLACKERGCTCEGRVTEDHRPVVRSLSDHPRSVLVQNEVESEYLKFSAVVVHLNQGGAITGVWWGWKWTDGVCRAVLDGKASIPWSEIAALEDDDGHLLPRLGPSDVRAIPGSGWGRS